MRIVARTSPLTSLKGSNALGLASAVYRDEYERVVGLLYVYLLDLVKRQVFHDRELVLEHLVGEDYGVVVGRRHLDVGAVLLYHFVPLAAGGYRLLRCLGGFLLAEGREVAFMPAGCL